MKDKKRDYTCIDKHPRGLENPIAKFKRYRGNIKAAYQRIKFGYCYKDVWSIDWWFLSIMPNMLDDLRKTAHGYPSEVSLFDTNIQSVVTDPEKEADAIAEWDRILSEMAFWLREANEDTCRKLNPYDEAMDVAHAEFRKKYGEWGEKLKTQEEIDEEKTKGVHIMHTLGDVPEYKELMDKYFEEQNKIHQHRNESKDKGIDLFRKWFWDLWD